MISAETKVSALLDAHPELLEFLAGYHPHFGKLRNRLLRRVMAPRVTLADAARIAGVDPAALVDALRRAAGETGPMTPEPRVTGWQPTPMPTDLAAIGADARTMLDVRPDIARGEEPFARIMAAVRELAPGHALELRTPFEPMPLYEILGRRGFTHWTERRAADDWLVSFWRGGPITAESATEAAHAVAASGVPPCTPGAGASAASTIDVRGLAPPQPMVLVLERLTDLGAGETLEVLHERRPMFLYPQLDERGFVHETDEREPGVVRIRIRRAATAR